MSALFSLVVCSALLGVSTASFVGSLILTRRARRWARESEAFLRQAAAERARAQAIHASCRPAPFDVPRLSTVGPFGVIRGGRA